MKRLRKQYWVLSVITLFLLVVAVAVFCSVVFNFGMSTTKIEDNTLIASMIAVIVLAGVFISIVFTITKGLPCTFDDIIPGSRFRLKAIEAYTAEPDLNNSSLYGYVIYDDDEKYVVQGKFPLADGEYLKDRKTGKLILITKS